MQKHDATRLHYDLRLELDGVLKSWAVTRGPSLVPGEKRLSVHTEDHPMEYLTFEGVIPKGEYGGGTMIVWDQGRWRPEGDPRKAYAKGHLDFSLEGQRLKGRWHLVRMRPRPHEKKEQWLLIKGDDEFARAPTEREITDQETTSILSGRTNNELATAGEVREDHAAREKATAERSAPIPSAAKIRGAKKAILPVFVEPALASLADTAPGGPGWLHEIKFDGYRLQARIDGSKVKLLTRKGLDWTDSFRAVAEALKGLKLGSALIDGEVVVEEESGVSSFTELQEALKAGRSNRMVFYAFDLLYLGGYDLTMPLVDRKTLLAGCLDDLPAGGAIRYSEHIETDGQAMLQNACRLGLEGIISKRKDQPYRSGRVKDWFKTKCTERQEFVIAGYVPSTTSSKMVGSLVMAVYDKGRLVHVGRVGTGFKDAVARSLRDQLERLKRPTSPFPNKLPADAVRGVRWVEPKLVAEVELRGWTSDGLLRHASYKGLREDKDPTEVVRETRPRGGEPPGRRQAFELTHPDRLLWPDVGLTKQGLAEFYADIADWVLPHLIGRPLSLVRCPSGTASKCFFQKHAWEGMAGSVKRRDIGDDEVLYIEDLDGLIALVQASVLEIHPWGSKISKVEAPDRITFDLDPGEDVAVDCVDRRRERGARAAAGDAARKFREDDGRQGPPRGRAAYAEGRLGHRESLRARSRGGDGERHPGQVHGHHLEERARREDLHRLPAQRAGRDRSRSLLRPRPGRRPCLHATGLERALSGDPTQPLHGRQPSDALAASWLRSVGKNRLGEAVAPERRAQEAAPAGRPWVRSWSTPCRRAPFTCASTCSGSSRRMVHGRRPGWSECCRQ